MPSALAQTLANEIAVQFLGRKKGSKTLSLIPAVHLPRPLPEKQPPFRRKFCILSGVTLIIRARGLVEVP